MGQVFFFPGVFWAFTLNGLGIGGPVSFSGCVARILTGKPYNWSKSVVSYSNSGQIVTAICAVPLLGYFSDWFIRYKARRNGGVHEPENRLVPGIVPCLVGVLCMFLFGAAAEYPYKLSWFAISFSVAAHFFFFLGCQNVASRISWTRTRTASPRYSSSSAPSAASSPSASATTSPTFFEKAGYLGAFGTYGGVTGLCGVFAVGLYFWGKPIRRYTERFVNDERKYGSA